MIINSSAVSLLITLKFKCEFKICKNKVHILKFYCFIDNKTDKTGRYSEEKQRTNEMVKRKLPNVESDHKLSSFTSDRDLLKRIRTAGCKINGLGIELDSALLEEWIWRHHRTDGKQMWSSASH